MITSGPPSAISVPQITQIVPKKGFQIKGSKLIPKLDAKLSIGKANKFAATAYQPKLAKLIIVDNTATPLLPSTALNQINKSIPYLTANNTGKHSIQSPYQIKANMFINICLNPKN